jgi:micrococcal nuclease
MKSMVKLLALSAAGLIALLGCTDQSGSSSQEPTNSPDVSGESAKVVRIIDGDTIDVKLNGDTYRVRYVGVNTPERDEPCYSDATNANADLVEDQTVTLVRDVSDTDKYGRLLRYVYVGNTFVNAELVAEGYAEAREYPPDTSYADYLEGLESTARSQNLNCYATGVFD